MFGSDDIPVTGSGNEDIAARGSLFHRGDFVPGHSGLESIDRVDLGDNDTSTIRTERFRALDTTSAYGYRKRVVYTYALADISESSDNSDLTGKHDISCALDTINQRLAAAVVVVELRLRDGVIHVNGRDLELAIAEHLVQVVNTSGGLF